MKRQTIISADTAGLTTTRFHVNENSSVTIAARGLAGVETITLQIYVNSGWTDVYQEDSVVAMTATNNLLYAVPVGIYRLVKSATAGATSVDMYNIGG